MKYHCINNYFYRGLPDSSKLLKILALLVSLSTVGAICGFIMYPLDKIYIASCVLSLFFLLRDRIQFRMRFVLLYIILIINVFVLNINPIFKVPMRLALFILVTMVSSSVILTQRAIIFRRYLFRNVVISLILLTIGSFICFFLGINLFSLVRTSISNQYEVWSSQGGLFSGLTVHSMILGPISVVSALTFFTLYLYNNKKIYIVLFFVSVMSAVFAASRGALLGIVFAIVFSLLIHKRIGKGKSKIIVLMIVTTLITLPFSDTAFKGVINKQEVRTQQNNGALNSRDAKFEHRLDEFASSPILGIGFASVGIDSGDYDILTGQIEPGSSHLAVLSMTGIFGFAVYLWILIGAYCSAKKSSDPFDQISLLVLLAILVHAMFEGYVFSAGGFLCFFYWLIIGRCYDSLYTKAIIKDEDSFFLK